MMKPMPSPLQPHGMLNPWKYAATALACSLAACMLAYQALPESGGLTSSDAIAMKPTSHADMLDRTTETVATTRRRRLLPSEVVSNIGPRSPKGESLWTNSHNVVHVINTRFFQHQSKLVHLQTARLDLFETFTLPSMLQQTNHDFLWIIWTNDDEKASSSRSSLELAFLELLQQQVANNNAVVVGASQDKHATFRELYGHSWTDLSAAVKAGNHRLLADYYQASQTHLLLETRLDADDALSHTFVESVQAQAAAAMGDKTSGGSTTEVYCPESHVEWRYYSGDKEDATTTGKLVHFRNDNFCIFSGLTTASSVGASREKRRALQVVNNGGNNCMGGGDVICPVRRKLEQLFETDVVQVARKRHHRRLVDDIDCQVVDVACYQCGQSLECLVADHGRDVSKVLEYLTAPPVPQGESGFCQLRRNGKGKTCAGQRCTPDDGSSISQAETLQAFALSSLAPDNTCPVVGSSHCPNAGTELKNFATYQIAYCSSTTSDELVEMSMDSCGSRCRGGTCLCAHGYADFCGGCLFEDDDDDGDDVIECRRQLRVLPSPDDDDTASAFSKSTPAASVLLARTPTAAGMKNVIPHQKGGGVNSIALSTYSDQETSGWQEMEDAFGLRRQKVANLRSRFEQNMENILIDAFAGQCTPGHSCKESTKRSLGLLLDRVQRRSQN